MDLWDDDIPIRQTGYLTDLLGRRAVEVINGMQDRGSRSMVSLHFNTPHWPWEGPSDEKEI
jgi:hypothetical protein